MWLPEKAFDLFRIAKVTVDSQREDLAAVRAERDGLRSQLATTQANLDWIRVRVNALEAERAQLLEKLYGIRIPVPEIARVPTPSAANDINAFSFEDIGNDMAKKLGLPVYE